MNLPDGFEAFVASHPEGRRVTARWLRDRAGWRVLTKARRRRLQLELLDVGIDTSPPLEDAKLDDLIALRALSAAAAQAPTTSSANGQSKGRHWRRLLGGWGALAAVAVILGLASDAMNLISLLPDHPIVPRLRGDVNIAVSRFQGVGQPNAQAQASQLSQSLVSALRRRAEENHKPLAPVIDVVGPGATDELAIGRPLDQHELNRLNATIGVTGTLKSEPQITVLSMALRINARQLHLARQIKPVIRRRIRMAGGISESISTRIRIRNQVVASIDVIENLLLGLGELESGHPDTARRLLGRVLADWSSSSGTETLYLLLGNALADEHRDSEARASYLRALKVRPGYGRARFAIAVLDFRHAAGDCSRAHMRAKAIWADRDTFDAIAEKAVSTLRVKALFARARADACLSQAGLANRFSAARASFGKVVAAYRSGTPDVRAEAAESFGWLALIALPERGTMSRPGARAKIAMAVRYYRHAGSLAIDPSRRQFFNAEAGRWSDRRGSAGRAPA